ncbi:MAG: nucleotidyltransferase domain-containing protein [Bacillota bacterium]|nr:nucleotidyltransferase domain-containing protein [Bacillota bacterium]
MKGEVLLKKIEDYFSHRDDTFAVYLFGSQAKGTARPTSDLDLAILFKEGLDPLRRFQIKLQITNELEELLETKVDLVDLRSADLFFIHQVMRHKVLLVEQDKSSRVAFEVDYRKRYFDHMPILELYNSQAHKRLMERDAIFNG